MMTEKEEIEKALQNAISVPRWTEDSDGLYEELESEEILDIVDNIFLELELIGYEIKKKNL